MANPILRPQEDDIIDVKKQSLYARLRRLFSTDVIVRNVGGKQLKIKDTDNIMYATDRNSLRDRFNRIRSTAYNAYTRDFALSYQAARMDLFRDYDCIGPDTIVPLPDGTYPTIKELAEKYKDNPQERFWVFSYDHETDSIKLGKAYHPRKKGPRIGFKVTFDNGQYVIGSIKHPFLMRNGEYKTIFDLKLGESVMPFYQKDFYGRGYRHLYNFSKGWQTEHKIIAEQFYRPLNENEVVHHKNHVPFVNTLENLQIMTKKNHSVYHSIYSLIKNRLLSNNTGWGNFKENIVNTLNHKIVSIESIGSIDVYDVTVDEYHNFATDNCFVSNTMDMDPIISCLSPDTYVATLEGFISIKDLTEKYSSGECFKVWSWNKDKQKLTIGNAHHPRKTGTKNVIEIHLDNGQFLKCTPDHRIMLIDGTYKEAQYLGSGDSLMPFYHRVNKNGYQEIKSLGSRFKSIHRYIFEDVFMDTELDGYNIHHKNHDKSDNKPENLEKMTDFDHMKLHGISPITKGKKSINSKEWWKNPKYRTQCSSALKRWQDSDDGKKMMSEHTSIINKDRWENDAEYALKMAQIFSDHAKSMWSDPVWKEWKRKKHSETMKLKYANDPTYAEKTKRIGMNNGRHKSIITTESVLIDGIKCNSLVEFARTFDFKGLQFKNDQYRCQFLSRRLKEAGYNGWTDYKSKFNYSNHKVTKIVDNNEITDVYDLTVDFYENFALKQGIICSNSALDIYADESLTYSEMGKILTVNSTNNNVKQILENLFTDILNIQHNLWSWTRNMVKYGDFYLKLYITPEYGVYMVDPISAYNVERIENSDPYNKRYVKFQLRPTDTSQAEVCENYEMAHFRLMSDSNFLPYGKCLVFDTQIDTTNGPKMIKDIENGDIVYSFDYNKKEIVLGKVLNRIMSGIKKVYEIKTTHRKIYATFEHPFMVKDGSYKQVKDLTLNDYLILPTINNSNNISYPKLVVEETDGWKYNSKLVKLDETIIKENFKEFIRFYGFLLGDGWLDKSNKTVAFSLGNRLDKSQKYLDFITHLGLKYRLTNELQSDSSVIINSVYLYKLIEQWGFKTGSNNKSVPRWIWNLPMELKKELLFGFADADGCDIDENTYQLGSINEKLINDLRIIAMECGLSTTKKWIVNGSGYNPQSQTIYFAYRLKSRDFIKFENGHHIEKIRSITECDKTEVYDIQIDNDLHNFIAEGVVVHNSMVEGARRVWKQLSLMEDAMLIHRIMRAPEKRIFYMDIGNIPPNEVDAYMEKQRNMMKKIPYMDATTGEYNLRFNLMNMVEDYLIAVRGGESGTKIDTLAGMDWTGTEDIEYLKNKMMAALKIPKAFLGFDESLCISPDTLIPLLSGKEKSMKELIKDYELGVKNYVYSIDEISKNIVPGEIEWAGFTRMNANVVRVHLDNNEYIDCTPDHRFMTRDGNWVEAKNLTENQSLMPLYTKSSTRKDRLGYTMVYHPSTEKYQEVHRLVAEYYGMIYKGSGRVVHHKNFNKINNYPENIDCSMSYWEHRKYHSNLSYKSINSPENIQRRINDPKWIQHARNAGRIGGLISAKKLGIWAKTHAPVNKGIRTGNMKKCPVCNKDFYTIKSVNKITCSIKCAASFFIENKRYNTKYINVNIERLIKVASESISFRDMEIKLGNIDRITLNKIFFYHKMLNKHEFIEKYMPLAKNNRGFMNNFRGKYKNHKVIKVEYLTNKIDTCDITIKRYHNFATSAGVIIHNSGKSTLASEDVRFARTIQRIQKILTSELTKIAIVHLYAQGYRDESLVDFDLELTNPSTIFEKEKIEIWSDKVDVAVGMMEAKLFSKDWIYKNIFHLSEDDAKAVKDEVVEDVKQNYRFASIEEGGEDPAKPFKKIGMGKVKGEKGGMPGKIGRGPGEEELPGELGGEEGEPEGEEKGSPEELVKETKVERDQSGEHKASDHPFGEDPLGDKEIHEKPKKNSEGKKKSAIQHNFAGGSPLAMKESKKRDNPDSTLISNLAKFLSSTKGDVKKELLSESQITGSKKSLLDEMNILE